MKRSMFLLGAMIAATPALAQQAPATGVAQPVPAAPDQVTPQTPPADAVQPAADATTAQPADAAAPAATGDQVASVVDQEFPTYDKDGDGKLTRAEFGAWMVALKAKSDPKASADAPATKTWVAGAFKQADTDQSSSVSRTELTGFLNSGDKSQG